MVPVAASLATTVAWLLLTPAKGVWTGLNHRLEQVWSDQQPQVICIEIHRAVQAKERLWPCAGDSTQCHLDHLVFKAVRAAKPELWHVRRHIQTCSSCKQRGPQKFCDPSAGTELNSLGTALDRY